MNLAILILSLNFTWAEPLRECSLAAITDNCKNLGTLGVDPWAAEEEAAGGIKNYSDTATPSMLNGNPDKYNKINDLSLRIQAKLVEKIKTKNPLFLFAISSPNMLRQMGSLLDPEIQKTQNGYGNYVDQPQLLLPWPPDQEGAQTQSVSWEKFRSEYLERLPEAERKLLVESAIKIKNEYKALNSAYEPPSAKESIDLSEEETENENENEKLKEVQEARFRRLFGRAKQLLIAELRERPANGDYKAAELFAKKLEPVEFSPDFGHSRCQSDPEGAFYLPTFHRVVVCSGLSKFSDAQLMMILGHELGHSIDLCYARNDVFQVLNPEKYSIFMEKMGVPRNLSDGAKHLSLLRCSLDKVEQKRLEELVRDGVLQNVVEGLKGSNPFQSTLTCMRERHKFFDKATHDDLLTEQRKRRLQGAASNSCNKSEVAYCDQNTEMQEALADVLGTKVLGRYLIEENSKSPKSDPIDAISFFAHYACMTERPSLDEGHPFSKERIEKIILADPSVAQIYNCRPSSDYYCMNKFGSLPPNPSSSKVNKVKSERGVK